MMGDKSYTSQADSTTKIVKDNLSDKDTAHNKIHTSMSINSQSLKHHPSGRLVSSVVNSTTPAALANLIAESENNTGHDGLTQIEAIMPSKDNQSYKKEVAMPSRAASVDGLLDGRTTKTNGHPASGNQAREQNFSYADGIPRSGGHVTDHDLRTPQSSPGHYNRAGTKHDSASTPHKTSVPHSPESIDLHGLEGTELDTLANKLGSVDLDGDTKSQGFLRGLSATKSSGQSFSSDGDLTRFVSAENVSKVFLAAQWQAVQVKARTIYCPISSNDTATIWFYMDDIRDAKLIKDNWPRFNPICSTRFMTAKEFFAGSSKEVSNFVTQYSGQVQVTACYTGDVMDAKLDEVYDFCHDLAKSFGSVRCLTVDKIISSTKATFRVEYDKLSSVDELTKSTGVGFTQDLKPNLSLTVDFYNPPKLQDTSPMQWPNYGPIGQPLGPNSIYNSMNTPIPLAVTIPLQSAPMPLQTSSMAMPHQSLVGTANEFRISPTKRTAWVGDRLLTGPNLQFDHQAPKQPWLAPVPAPPMTNYSSPYENQYGHAALSDYGSVSTIMSPHTSDHHTPLSTPTRGSARSRYPSPHAAQRVDPANIENGTDVRTTLMIRNIPNRVNFNDMKAFLEETSKGMIDFLYIRMDFGNSCNVGYGFVNFIRPEYIVPFLQARVDKPWPGFSSEKICQVSYATIQGQDCLIQKFRNSSVMEEYPGFRPKLLYHMESLDIPPGKQIGDEAEFPAPDNLQKLHRSLGNAETIGLYPARSQHGLVRTTHRPRTQYDRGTPRALQDEAYATRRPLTNRNRGYSDFSNYTSGAFSNHSARSSYTGGVPLPAEFGPIGPLSSQNTQTVQPPRYFQSQMEMYQPFGQSMNTAQQPVTPLVTPLATTHNQQNYTDAMANGYPGYTLPYPLQYRW